MRSAAPSRSQPWFRLALVAAVTLGAAGCSSDTYRFSDRTAESNSGRLSSDLTGTLQPKLAPPINATTLPPPPSAQVAPVTSTAAPPAAPKIADNPPVKPVTIPTATPARKMPTHAVVSGDTLHKIARQYNVSLTELAAVNKLSTNSKLKLDSQLVIPASRPTQLVQPKTVPNAKSNVTLAENAARKITPTPDLSAENKDAASSPALTFRWPVRGRVIAGFGPKPNGHQNDGINFAVPEGTPVKAAEDGVVIYANNEIKSFGNLLLIRHNNGFVTAYAHVSEILVKREEVVKRGQVVAKSGQTGSVSSPQLHFEIRKGRTPVDPMPYLDRGSQA